MAILDPERKTIASTLLGDSTYMILRPDEKAKRLNKIFRSEEQQHYFNCPFQCGSSGDDPIMAHDEVHHNIEIGDIIVMGTDGVYDNTFDEEIIKLLEDSFDPASEPKNWGVVSNPK